APGDRERPSRARPRPPRRARPDVSRGRLVACVGEHRHPLTIVGMIEPALPTAVVLDVRWTNGLAAIRSLGRAGVPVVAVAHARRALGFSSRYATPFVCPHPVKEGAAYVDALERLGDGLD